VDPAERHSIEAEANQSHNEPGNEPELNHAALLPQDQFSSDHPQQTVAKEALIAEDDRAAMAAGDGAEGDGAEVQEEAVVTEAPQRRRPRRSSRVVEVPSQTEVTATPAAASETEGTSIAGEVEGASEEALPRRRPRRVPRPRATRRSPERSASPEADQVELGLLEVVELQAAQTGQAQPEQMTSTTSVTFTMVESRAGAGIGGQAEAPTPLESSHQGVAMHSETDDAPVEPRQDQDERLNLAGETASEALANQEPAPAPTQDQEPARPKRSGWWQRAKATLRG
jgi:ribonuclease E